MILKEFEYSQYKSEKKEWKLCKVCLSSVNLFVGKNATGKSRTINVIAGLAKIITLSGDLKYCSGEYKASFLNKSDEKVEYELTYSNYKVTKELLVIAGKTYLKRGIDSVDELWYEKEKTNISFGISDKHIAIAAKRDSVQHPYIEELSVWAENVVVYHFGGDLGKSAYSATKDIKEVDTLDYRNELNVVDYFDRGTHLKKDFKEDIINDLNSIGYEIEDIQVATGFPARFTDAKSLPEGFSNPKGLLITESDIAEAVPQMEISQGMFRALSIIIHINYALLEHEPSTILIDDIGEGLDFSRSKLLINLLIDKNKKSDYQLIMTTNDQFVMNSVDLEYWNILKRKGSSCSVINIKNSPDLFQDFKFTGLSNFDLLASGFYEDTNSTHE